MSDVYLVDVNVMIMLMMIVDITVCFNANILALTMW